jgi:hypothetical protein
VGGGKTLCCLRFVAKAPDHRHITVARGMATDGKTAASSEW